MSYIDELKCREIDIDRDLGIMNIVIDYIWNDGGAAIKRSYVPLTLLLPSHRGITYSSGDERRWWWFGFDCSHRGDLVPMDRLTHNWVYRDQDYVYGIVTRLAWAVDELHRVFRDAPIISKR